MTKPDPYTNRLERLSGARWKRLLNVQAPYRWNILRLEPGHVLDVGCGIGRNLLHLDGNGVGIDTSQASVEVARKRGCTAYTVDSFLSSPDATFGRYDSLLLAHVLEHMPLDAAIELVHSYLPYVKPGGKVIVIVPQRAGYASDDTHVNFLDSKDVTDLLEACGLQVTRSYSFPFTKAVGRVFRHNETIVVAQTLIA
ncbi:MAG: class I SAM-dependent methyltransferase [Acidimicrobiia bacterium]